MCCVMSHFVHLNCFDQRYPHPLLYCTGDRQPSSSCIESPKLLLLIVSSIATCMECWSLHFPVSCLQQPEGVPQRDVAYWDQCAREVHDVMLVIGVSATRQIFKMINFVCTSNL